MANGLQERGKADEARWIREQEEQARKAAEEKAKAEEQK